MLKDVTMSQRFDWQKNKKRKDTLGGPELVSMGGRNIREARKAYGCGGSTRKKDCFYSIALKTF
jgi:hypothetical protein